MRILFLLLACRLMPVPVSSQSLFELSVDCIKRYEGLHTARHYPYVGYGHKLMDGETFTADMDEACADSLLRADLLRRCALFRNFGRDSLLLCVLAYNVGETRVMRSRLVKKLREGNRDVYREYVSFRLIKGQVSTVLVRRRKEEFELLFND